ncbi:MAG: hypothetical protein AB7S26_28430 [Sandaracinaceae bacterium]
MLRLRSSACARRLAVGLTAVTLGVVALALSASRADAQDMNIALSRLRIPAVDSGTAAPNTPCAVPFDMSGNPIPMDFCQDDPAWQRVMTQFAGAMMPPVLTTAGTRGVRGIYVGFETWLTPIESDASGANATGSAWHRAVEGDGLGGSTTSSRFVDSVLAWGRFNLRKGLPFGFDLGMNIGYLANSSYWTLGLEVRWALFEGFRDGVGWIPDLAVRAAVQTLLGDSEFNMTIPTVDVILSEPFVIANTVEVTPSVFGQVGWIFADSELVDLTPGTPIFPSCNPDPLTPTSMSGGPPYCRGSGRELNHNVVFSQIRSTRFRLGGGLQIRYEWFQIGGSFLFDVLTPHDMDGTLPSDLPRQMQIDISAGVTL